MDKGDTVTCCRWMGPREEQGSRSVVECAFGALLAPASPEAREFRRCATQVGASRVVPSALYHSTVLRV